MRLPLKLPNRSPTIARGGFYEKKYFIKLIALTISVTPTAFASEASNPTQS